MCTYIYTHYTYISVYTHTFSDTLLIVSVVQFIVTQTLLKFLLVFFQIRKRREKFPRYSISFFPREFISAWTLPLLVFMSLINISGLYLMFQCTHQYLNTQYSFQSITFRKIINKSVCQEALCVKEYSWLMVLLLFFFNWSYTNQHSKFIHTHIVTKLRFSCLLLKNKT